MNSIRVFSHRYMKFFSHRYMLFANHFLGWGSKRWTLHLLQPHKWKLCYDRQLRCPSKKSEQRQRTLYSWYRVRTCKVSALLISRWHSWFQSRAPAPFFHDRTLFYPDSFGVFLYVRSLVSCCPRVLRPECLFVAHMIPQRRRGGHRKNLMSISGIDLRRQLNKNFGEACQHSNRGNFVLTTTGTHPK